MSTTFASSPGVGMVNRASFMWCAYVESSPPSVRRKGKTCSATTVYMSFASKFLKRDQRKSSYGRPFGSLPSGKICRSIGFLSRSGLTLFQGVQLVETADEQEVGDLLDDFEGISDAP